MKFRLVLAALIASAFIVSSAHAHKAFMLVRLNDEPMLVVETGFSTGETGAGLPLILEDMATGEELATYVVDDDGITELPIPKVPYVVTFEGGPGHRVTKDGPMPETAPSIERGEVHLVDVLQGDPARLEDALREQIAEAEVVVCFERIARRLADLLKDATVVVVDDRVPLGGASDVANELRDRVAARIEKAVAAGEDVAVLTEGPAKVSADWAWVAESMSE